MAPDIARRLTSGVTRGNRITLYVDDRPISAYAGESLATALLAAGYLTLRHDRTGRPRGPYCNMGVCFDCLVRVDDQRVRACMTAAAAGLRVSLDKPS